MRHSRANVSGDRSNALWGRGSRNELRSNALWGRGGRRAGAVVSVIAVFAMASVAGAGLNGGASSVNMGGLSAYIPTELLSSIAQNPGQTFDVIVQGDKNGNSNGLMKQLAGDSLSSSVKAQFTSIDGVRSTLTGSQILSLGKRSYVTSIMANETVRSSGYGTQYSNTQLWPWAAGAPVNWTDSSPDAGTIAIVDSGIDASRTPDFGGRVLAQVNMTSLGPNSAGDGLGHGTFVAGIAAGAAPGAAGAAPKAELLSIDVMNDQGQATVGDVVKAADFILANKTKYNIKVANFSLHSVNRASVMFDPLDQAVEKLWLNGVVVWLRQGTTEPIRCRAASSSPRATTRS
jgi:Subtilase family.